MIEVDVLVAGGGPVGLTTALELQSRGIKVLLVERNLDTSKHPKLDVTNTRSMEHFKRLGVSEQIRDVGVPRDHNMDISWVTRLNEWELARFCYQSADEWAERIRAQNDGTQAREPWMRMSQVILEPKLREFLLASPFVEVRFGWELTSLVQDDSGVTATITSADGEVETVRSTLLAGCDGGRSRARAEVGIKLVGEYNVVPFYMIHFETETPEEMQPFGIALHYQSPSGGTLIAQDDVKTFTLHNVVGPDFDPATVDPKKLLFESLGKEFPCTILLANPWSPHLVFADRYGKGRVWLAGDSAHQYIPTGGYGMNTGICDAVDLGWKYAAVIQGWGGPVLLESIDSERRPVALKNCETAERHMGIRQKIAEAYDLVIHEDSEKGALARKVFGERIIELGNAENEMFGIELGFRYRDSPIICGEGDEPEWDPMNYVPSTWPGVRAPHVFLENGEAIFDLFGQWFTLVRFADIDTSAFEQAAARRGVPLHILDIREEHVRNIYERDLVLIRPDQHVAWRSNLAPSDPLAIIDRVRGA